jgi:hypothetical protein
VADGILKPDSRRDSYHVRCVRKLTSGSLPAER